MLHVLYNERHYHISPDVNDEQDNNDDGNNDNNDIGNNNKNDSDNNDNNNNDNNDNDGEDCDSDNYIRLHLIGSVRNRSD